MRRAVVMGMAAAATALLCAVPLPAQQGLDAQVTRSVNAAVAYLKSVQRPDGGWNYMTLPGGFPAGAGMPMIQHWDTGATALVGVTLLECGVPKDDRNVLAAANYVRKAVRDMQDTYSISCAIMFLDRLGSPGDVESIRILGMRLVAAQLHDGGWTYQAQALSAAEHRQKFSELSKQRDAIWRADSGLGQPGPKDNLKEDKDKEPAPEKPGPKKPDPAKPDPRFPAKPPGGAIGGPQAPPGRPQGGQNPNGFPVGDQPPQGDKPATPPALPGFGPRPGNRPPVGGGQPGPGGGIPLPPGAGAAPAPPGFDQPPGAGGSPAPPGPGGFPMGPGGGGPGGFGGFGGHLQADNSNTQFATLALWIAKRKPYEVPTEMTLERLERRFQTTQQQDGGWVYGSGGGGSTPSMTCAGLIGLAASYGVVIEREATLRAGDLGGKGGDGKDDPAAPGRPVRRGDLTKEKIIQDALKYLGNELAEAEQKGLANLGEKPDDIRTNYYFMWSIERVGGVYAWRTIGNTDWYRWGANLLIQTQQRDGSWRGTYGVADTCFALLFLRRSNLAPDLTARVTGEAKLVAGDLVGRDGPKAPPKPKEPGPKEPPSGILTPKEPNPPALPRPNPPAIPEDPTEREALRLMAELITATGPQQTEVLQQLQQGKGTAYTSALLEAIPKLTGDGKDKARTALSERLARMTPKTVRAYMELDDAEARRAAAAAVARKESRELIPNLIALLTDTDRGVVGAAHDSLKTLSGKDFGPAAGASPADRKAAADRWQAWWQANNK